MNRICGEEVLSRGIRSVGYNRTLIMQSSIARVTRVVCLTSPTWVPLSCPKFQSRLATNLPIICGKLTYYPTSSPLTIIRRFLQESF